jgi:hypothetical protein
MADVPLVFLEAPALDWLDQAAMAAWLDLDVRTLRKYVRQGVFQKPKRRKGEKHVGWDRTDGALMKWRLHNDDRFEGGDDAATVLEAELRDAD